MRSPALSLCVALHPVSCHVRVWFARLGAHMSGLPCELIAYELTRQLTACERMRRTKVCSRVPLSTYIVKQLVLEHCLCSLEQSWFFQEVHMKSCFHMVLLSYHSSSGKHCLTIWVKLNTSYNNFAKFFFVFTTDPTVVSLFHCFGTSPTWNALEKLQTRYRPYPKMEWIKARAVVLFLAAFYLQRT